MNPSSKVVLSVPRSLTALLLLLLVVSCVSQPQTPPASPSVAVTTASAAPAPTPTPSPTPDDAAEQAMQLLALRDEDQLKGDEKALLALLDTGAAPEFRERELGLLRAQHDRAGAAPKRTFLRRVPLALGDAIQSVEVAEEDDQGRTRRVRYFLNYACCTRLTEPAPDKLDAWLGPVRTLAGNGYAIRYRDVDTEQAQAADTYAKDALTTLAARLGASYRLDRPFTITLAPTTIAELPAQASGFTNGNEITLLSSVSMVVASGPGSEWARTVVTHEISHVLLFAHGNGPWALSEGLPLWLTNDQRRPELDRLVATKTLWDLPHLLEGPRTPSEFYAGYAQASSFVRYLAATYGDRAVLAAWEAGASGRSTDEAFRAAFGVGTADAYAGWRASLRPSA